MSPWILRVGAADERLLMAVAVRRRASWSRFFRLWTHLGDPPGMLLAGTLLLLGGLGALGGSGGGAPDARFGDVPLQVSMLRSFVALALAHLLSQALKRIISRPRPKLPEGLPSLAAPPDHFSFPSGHASATLALVLPLILSVPSGIGVLLLSAALLVGISRCYLGVHYPGDVLAGWGLAVVAWGFSATLV